MAVSMLMEVVRGLWLHSSCTSSRFFAVHITRFVSCLGVYAWRVELVSPPCSLNILPASTFCSMPGTPVVSWRMFFSHHTLTPLPYTSDALVVFFFAPFRSPAPTVHVQQRFWVL